MIRTLGKLRESEKSDSQSFRISGESDALNIRLTDTLSILSIPI